MKKRLLALTLSVLMIITLLSGCALKPYVMIVDGVKVRQGTFAYYYSNAYASFYDTYGDDGVSYYAFTSLCQHILVNRLFDELGLEFTEDDQKSVENLRTSWINKLGGQAQYAEFLRTLGLTDTLYREILEVQVKFPIIRDKLFGEGGDYETTEDDLRELYRTSYVHALHIFISTADIETTEDYAAAEERANEAHDRAVAGEDFPTLIIEYGGDPTLAANPYAGYYVGTGTLDSETENMLFGLDIGEVSQVYTTTDGFYIYKRIAFDEKYLDNILADGTVFDEYLNNELYYYMLDIMSGFEVEYYDEYYEVNFASGAGYWISES